MRACLLALVIASSFPAAAFADEPTGPVTVLPPIIIVARPQGPSVVPVLSRGRFRYRAPDLERHGTDAILESVTHPPF